MTSIFITGIGRGIGLELARQSSGLGWQVGGSVRTLEDLNRVTNLLPEISVLQFDVIDHSAIDKAALSYKQPIDILINNAGVIGPERQSTLDMDFDGFARTLAINTIAPLKIAQAFLPQLKKSDNPRLVTISSSMGRMQYAKSDRIAYRASKSAANKIVQALATDLMEFGVCVVAIDPGWVRTQMGGEEADIAVEESAEGILKVVDGLGISDTSQFIEWNGTRSGF
ncbi:MAG: SDR family NAD(P)-dependent oxidoreductase [Rhizobiaceae bacterium]|nr:SDR family NAD(P)-dependent oxidoreductase [Rhizobiaceae bacterium]